MKKLVGKWFNKGTVHCLETKCPFYIIHFILNFCYHVAIGNRVLIQVHTNSIFLEQREQSMTSYHFISFFLSFMYLYITIHVQFSMSLDIPLNMQETL